MFALFLRLTTRRVSNETQTRESCFLGEIFNIKQNLNKRMFYAAIHEVCAVTDFKNATETWNIHELSLGL